MDNMDNIDHNLLVARIMNYLDSLPSEKRLYLQDLFVSQPKLWVHFISNIQQKTAAFTNGDQRKQQVLQNEERATFDGLMADLVQNIDVENKKMLRQQLKKIV